MNPHIYPYRPVLGRCLVDIEIKRYLKPSEMEPVLKRPSYDPKQDGQDGRPVHIDDNSLTEAEKTERQRLRDRFMIDHMISEKVSLHRRPGEHRHKKCIDLANKGYRLV